MNIAIIDDDTFALKLLARQLEKLGVAQVQRFDRARDALAMLEGRIDAATLVFCDLQMPDMDGVEFVRNLARIDFRGDLVLISGEDARILQTVRRLATAHGICLLATLSKPASEQQLRAVLDLNHATQAGVSARSAQPVLAGELQQAIEQRQFINHYQPKVHFATGTLAGVETLVRWDRPGHGLVYPDQFITLAEQANLIDALTWQIVAAALDQARRWADAGLVTPLAVNVSMDSLADLDFPDVVARLAQDAGIAPTAIVLEVTESRLMRDARASLDILSRLRLKRIGLSIDDFGTGHSSLVQLRDMPFSELKLDRSFVTGAHRDPALRAIVRATLTMTRELGMAAVAEGVETIDDWRLLRSLGCDMAQGYFIARPMAGADLPAWLDRWRLRRESLTEQDA